jgi:geranylgeranyl pyrophosphate synthase
MNIMKKLKGRRESGEQLIAETRKIIAKEGAKSWTLAKETLLQQETQSSQLKEAITYAAFLPDFFRPAIVSFCCKAVGGESEITIPCGASLILLGKAVGIHDDIIDNLKVRNKRRTLFGEFGKEIALITSDILLFKGFTLMRKNAEKGVAQRANVKILDTIDRFWFQQSESEILEVQSRRRTTTTPQECLEKIKMRASELEATTRIGGILGDGPEKEIEALGKYGRLFGMASILRDELIDMLEPDALRNRMKHESLPLPLVYAMKDSELKRKVTQIISKSQFSNKTLQRICEAADALDGMNYVAETIQKVIHEAQSSIGIFKGKNEELGLLATSVIIRPTEWKSVLQAT